jgi:hypothetical protein
VTRLAVDDVVAVAGTPNEAIAVAAEADGVVAAPPVDVVEVAAADEIVRRGAVDDDVGAGPTVEGQADGSGGQAHGAEVVVALATLDRQVVARVGVPDLDEGRQADDGDAVEAQDAGLVLALGALGDDAVGAGVGRSAAGRALAASSSWRSVPETSPTLTVSGPPRVAAPMTSTLSRVAGARPPSRKRTSGPEALTSKRSPAAVPAKVTLSKPSPPSTRMRSKAPRPTTTSAVPSAPRSISSRLGDEAAGRSATLSSAASPAMARVRCWIVTVLAASA